MIFNTVTHLMVNDKIAFNHKFFIRLVRSFLFVKHLSVSNICSPFFKHNEHYLFNVDSSSIVKYSHLISLYILHAHTHSLNIFLVLFEKNIHDYDYY